MRSVIVIAALAPFVAAGCAAFRSAGVEHAAASPICEPTAAYRIGCPDVLAVRFADRPDLDCVAAVDLDGRLLLSESLSAQVEGGTMDDARLALATTAGCDPARVAVHLADARTGKVYLFGPDHNRQRVLPYVGPERLTDFLSRTGSVQTGCADLRDVSVVRPNVAAGRAPEVFHADLRLVQAGDGSTNITLEPGDQVFVGETRRSSFARLLPDWMQRGYCRLAGVSVASANR